MSWVSTETITRIVTWLVDLDLADFEHVDLNLPIRGGQQHGGGLDRLGISCRSEHLKLRHLTAQPVNKIKLCSSAVRGG
jgi:hypothetical protein